MFVGISLIKGDDICFSQHHGTKLLLCNVVDDSSFSGCEMCRIKHDMPCVATCVVCCIMLASCK